RCININKLNTKIGPERSKQSVCASVHIFCSNHFISQIQQSQYNIGSSYPTTKSQNIYTIFQFDKSFLQYLTRWISGTGIIISFVFIRGTLHKCGRLKYGSHNSSGRGIWLYPGMNDFSIAIHLIILLRTLKVVKIATRITSTKMLIDYILKIFSVLTCNI